jgi:branched-chain amino acid transport system permease protein
MIDGTPSAVLDRRRFGHPMVWLILVVLAIFAGLPAVTGDVALRETLFLGAVAIILASSLNLMIGYTGYVNFGNIVFFGLGGYFGVWLATAQGWPILGAMVAAAIIVGAISLVFGYGILRLRGAYFALATIGINEAVRAFVSNLDVWGGSTGMYLSTTVYQSLGGPRQALWVVYYAVIVLMGAALLLSWLIRRSKFGLGLFAIREDEDAAAVLGVYPALYKSIIYSVSGLIPAMTGALFFFKNGVIQPDQAFDLTWSTEVIVMLMLGGQGSVVGAALGAFLYDQLRSTLLTSSLFSQFHLVIAGVLLLLIILFVPGGLMGWITDRWPKTRGTLE